MSRLRTATFLARLVLAWFVLQLGAAVAAPLVQPQRLQLVCAGGTLKLVPGGGEEAPVALAVDCPLCSVALAPPPVAGSVPVLSSAPPKADVAILAVQPRNTAAPPPARGPPGDPNA